MRAQRADYWVFVAACAVAVLLAFRQSSSLPATLGSTWTQVIMVICGLAWVASRLYRDADPAGQRTAWLIALLSFSVTALSWGVSAASGMPVGADRETMDLAMVNDLVLLLFFGFLLTNILTTEAVHLLVKVVVASTTISATFGVFQQVSGIDIAAMIRPPLTRPGGSILSRDLLREGFVRAQGAAGHPLELATLVAMALPLAVATALAARASGRRTWPWALCVVILSASLTTSLSRSALLGSVLAFGAMSLLWNRRRLVNMTLFVGVGLVAVLAVRPGLINSFVTIFLSSATDDSLYSREFGRQYAIDMWLQQPWLGVGPSGYAVPHYPVLDNQYLGRLVETGIIGLVATVTLWASAAVAVAVAAYRLRRSTASVASPLGEICAGLIGTMVVILFSNGVLDTLGFRQVSTLTWVVMALCWASLRLSHSAEPDIGRNQETSC